MASMKKMTFLTTIVLTALVAGTASAVETASATLSSTSLGGGEFQYNIALTNTSTDSSNIGTFWFSWIPGNNYMEAVPSNATEPTGWLGNLESGGGHSIQWVDNTGSLLAPGATDQFSFDSTEPPSQLEGISTEGNKLVETTSFIYTGEPFSDAGTQFVVPEPATLGMLALCGGSLLLRRRRAA